MGTVWGKGQNIDYILQMLSPSVVETPVWKDQVAFIHIDKDKQKFGRESLAYSN